MNEWYFQRALSKSFKMSPHMTILGHSPRIFVLQNIYCGCGCGTTPHVKNCGFVVRMTTRRPRVVLNTKQSDRGRGVCSQCNDKAFYLGIF